LKRNFRLIFQVLLSVLIITDILLFAVLGVGLYLGIKSVSIVNIIFYDLFVSFFVFIEFILRIRIEEDKSSYIKENWTDIIAFLPLSLMGFISPNEKYISSIIFIIKIFALINFIRKTRRIVEYTSKTGLDIATVIVLSTVVLSSIFFLLAEKAVNPGAQTLDSSLFFIIISMTTVGYGNVVPYTGLGQLITIIAILVGVAYTGWVTVALVSSFIIEFRKEREKAQEKLNKTVDGIVNKLDTIEKKIDKIENEKKK
jgi:voltage-gated potassium channel